MKITLALITLVLATAHSAFALSQKDVVGTWRLESYTILDGAKEKPWCGNPYGIISYFSNGYMAVGINCKDEGGAIVTDPKDMVFYTGTYEIKGDRTLLHHVENSSDVTRIGKQLERTAELKNDRITLTGMGTKGLVKLIWKKIR